MQWLTARMFNPRRTNDPPYVASKYAPGEISSVAGPLSVTDAFPETAIGVLSTHVELPTRRIVPRGST